MVVETRCTTVGIAIPTGNPPYSIRPYCRAAGASRSQWCGRGRCASSASFEMWQGRGTDGRDGDGPDRLARPCKVARQNRVCSSVRSAWRISVPIGRRACHRSEPCPGAAGGRASGGVEVVGQTIDEVVGAAQEPVEYVRRSSTRASWKVFPTNRYFRPDTKATDNTDLATPRIRAIFAATFNGTRLSAGCRVRGLSMDS